MEDKLTSEAHTHNEPLAIELWQAFILAEIEPAVLQEIIDNPRFAQLIATMANSSLGYLLPVKNEPEVELVATEPITLDTKVTYLPLGGWYLQDAFRHAGIRTVRDLVLRGTDGLLRIKGIGPSRLRQVSEILAEAGISLAAPGDEYWNTVAYLYDGISNAPIELLYEKEVVRDNAHNRRILANVQTIGELSSWTRKKLNTISGDPAQHGKQQVEAFLRSHDLREEADAEEERKRLQSFTLISPPAQQ
ncbi:MAG: hypothetical protein V4611_04005 [Patescibacteria group bacterium]